MYPASDEFHEAVANGNEQKALLIFSDCVFTDDDIDVEQGIEFTDYFNTETDLSIGQANSNEIRFTLFNDDRLLNNYTFGDFLATLGVLLDQDMYPADGNCMCATNSGMYIGRSTSPYLTRAGRALGIQPDFAVYSILAYDDKVYAFGNNGQYAVYKDSTATNITQQVTVNSFMRNRSKRWIGKGMFYDKQSRILQIREGGVRKEYEFVPLGWFTAKRPEAPNTISVSLTCHDYMQKFDDDMPGTSELGISYPITIGELYAALCDHVGVTYETSTFINSTAVIRSKPEDFDRVTMREVIKWIAEAAASNARFDRDGVLKLDWLRATDVVYTEGEYEEAVPTWYATKKITKLYNRNTHGGSDRTVGGGDEAYLIQDNPLLRGVS